MALFGHMIVLLILGSFLPELTAWDNSRSHDDMNNEIIQEDTPSSEPASENIKMNMSCRCGQGKDTLKIVGGYAAVKNSRPWMAALFRSGTFFCGGSLINDRYILTAAHCADDAPASDLSVRLGAHMLNESEPQAVERRVAKTIMHPKFDPSTLVYDIALLRMDAPVVFNNDISTICLPSSDAGSFEWTWATLNGWGLTSYLGKPSPHLKEIEVQIYSNMMCELFRPVPSFQIQPSNICANKPGWVTYEGACNGDSGSALIILDKNKKQWEQMGIVSYGTGLDCGNPYTPDVYTRITAFKDFIRENTPDAMYCNGTTLN